MICEEHAGSLIEHIEHISHASDCQAICQNHPECANWSHWLEGDGHDHWGHCTMHTSCTLTRHECFAIDSHECEHINPIMRGPEHKCQCQSGGTSPDLDDCGDAPPTPLPCIGDFWPGLRCDEHENTIEHIEHIPSRSDCQAICQNHEGCEFFSHYLDEHGEKGDCFLHYQCDNLVEKECDAGCFDTGMRPGKHCSCFCGPAYPDLDDCSEAPAF